MRKRTNIGIFAHVDAGKTTVTEQLLYKSGAVRNSGSVDDGTATTDWLDIEKSRGISVSAACAEMNVNGHEICIVDTPGHVDFAGEVERSLSALDGAVLVVTAVEGVQSYTEVLWRALEKLKLPTVIVINKIDREGADIDAVIKSLDRLTGGKTALINCAESTGSTDCTVGTLTGSRREDTLLRLADFDSRIEEKLFSDGDADDTLLTEALAAGCTERRIFPTVVVSAKLSLGIDTLLTAITELLPDSSRSQTDELSGVIFRVMHDSVMGKICFIRLFGGRLEARSTVAVPNSDKMNKITQLRRYSGRKYTDLSAIDAGDIAAVGGLTDFKNGDVIGSLPDERRVSITDAIIRVGVKPKDEQRRPAVLNALGELTEEEPMLGLEVNPITREIYIKITGMIQLEVVRELMSSRFGLDPEFSEPRVIYRETPRKTGVGKWAYVMPKPCWAIVELTMEPLPKGSGLQFRSAIKEGTLARRYQHHVETSVFETAQQGIYGWEVTDALVTLTDGMSHSIHTHPLDFFVCTPVSFLRALTDCGSQLLEPYITATMTASEDLLGKILGQIIDMRGEFDSPVIENGQFTLTATMPLADSMDFPLRFRSLTSGRGVYSSSLSEYRPCRDGQIETLARRSVDPLDLDKWILFRRSAITEQT